MSAEKRKISTALKSLQGKYLRAEGFMMKPEGATQLREFLPKVDSDYQIVMKLCESMSDSDTLPDTISRKADCCRGKEEFDNRVKQWLSSLEEPKFPSPQMAADGLSVHSSRASTSSSIRSEIRRSRVKLKIARLASDQAAADQRKVEEEIEAFRREAEEDARRRREEAEKEARRRLEEVRKNAHERKKQLDLAKVEAEAWEEESVYDAPTFHSSTQSGPSPTDMQRKHDVKKSDFIAQQVPLTFSNTAFEPRAACETKTVVSPQVRFLPGHRTDGVSLPPLTRVDCQEVGERFLPRPVVQKFDGDPMNYWLFVRQFDVHIAKKARSDDMRLLFLLQHCEPAIRERLDRFNAKDPVEGYRLAWQTLYEEFGQPHTIAHRCEELLTAAPVVEAHDPDGLMNMSVLLDKCCTSLHDARQVSIVDSIDIMLAVARKLPSALRDEWIVRSTEIETRTGRRADFSALAEFVAEKSRQANSIFGKGLYPPKKGNKMNKNRVKVSSHNTVTSVPPRANENVSPVKERHTITTPTKCVLCYGSHKLSSCPEFMKKNYAGRRAFVRDNKLCFKCLVKGHMARDCTSTLRCNVEGCKGQYHHSLLHKQGSDSVTSGIPTQEYNATVNAASVFLNVVPVVVRYGGRAIGTYAFLDQGSTTTFCERKLMEKLGAEGKPKRILLNTMTMPRELDTVAISVSVEPWSGGNTIDLPEVVVVDNIPVKPNKVPTTQQLNSHRSLRKLKLSDIPGATVTLLIGANVPVAHRVQSLRRGDEFCPDAVRTPLGWSLLGRTFDSTDPNVCDSFTSSIEVAHAMFLNEECDSLSMNGADDEFLQVPSSREDRRTLKIMKDSVDFVDGHYQLPLPWRHDYQEMVNNRKMAEKRLLNLKRRLERDPVRHSRYAEQMQATIDKGYAEQIPKDEIRTNRRVWYIPHHGVENPKKPDKLRVVFDCAAQYHGLSLNQVLMQGPDFLNSLVGVLLRFRKEPIALVADIEAMFYQVRVSPRDQDALRFLWWPGGDTSKEAVPHRMKVHLFGATSSPSCAAFCLRQAATDFGSQFETLVASTIERNFYVDDCLTSVTHVDTALSLVDGLRSLLAKAGFRLTKWLSNSKEVLDKLPEEELAKSLQVHSLDSDLQERVLGVQWNVQADCFKFAVTLPLKPRTRRGLLSTMNSLFDPLGLVTPVVLEARFIYRSLCQQELEWDEPMPDKDLRKWERWLSCLPELRDVLVPRSFNLCASDNIQGSRLHLFCDASKEAYGAVCYLRTWKADKDVECVLVMAKSRLAPKDETTIPRLELMAAVLAVKMELMIRKEIGLDLRPSIFWTDSSIVLQSIFNDRRRFPLFVSRRLAYIEKHSCVRNWKHVPTKQNPADLASRGVNANALVKSKLWFSGPSFLLEGPEKWPDLFERNDDEVDSKVFEKKPVHAFVVVETACPLDLLLSRYSTLYKLKRAVAWLLRFKSFLLRGIRGQASRLVSSSLTVDELKSAELELVKYVQSSEFSQWLAGIKKDGSSSRQDKSSSVFKLNPIVVEGVLRVGGRLEKAPVSYEMRHPAILPHNSCLTDLMIMDCHERCGHSGVNHTLTLLNQRVWIVKGAVAVRRVLNRCLKCHRRNAKPGKQLMSELPSARLQINMPPFSYTGVDYFGPLLVKLGRSQVKRYGCLFTCLTTRAVHLEVASDLSTDAFINAFRRFIARRGTVLHMYSDNGTNFVGAERELREGIKEWNQRRIDEYLKQRDIQWTFNPPSASHMGGAWERMIRSARRILIALTEERILTDDLLQTLLLEVESILNSRPLTPVTLDIDDETPLTPNHLLRVNPDVGLPPTITSERDVFARRGWLRVQRLADLFWKRWSREYLRTIIARQKWHSARRNLQADDVVLLVDNSTPRSSWSLGRVVAVHPDKYGVVRSVIVRSKGNDIRRPVHKLCLLLPAGEGIEQLRSKDGDQAVTLPSNEGL